jgi:hypothetical protein
MLITELTCQRRKKKTNLFHSLTKVQTNEHGIMKEGELMTSGGNLKLKRWNFNCNFLENLQNGKNFEWEKRGDMYSKSRNKGMEFGEFKLCHFEF